MPLKDRLEMEIKDLKGVHEEIDNEEAAPGTFAVLLNFEPSKTSGIQKHRGAVLYTAGVIV